MYLYTYAYTYINSCLKGRSGSARERRERMPKQSRARINGILLESNTAERTAIKRKTQFTDPRKPSYIRYVMYIMYVCYVYNVCNVSYIL